MIIGQACICTILQTGTIVNTFTGWPVTTRHSHVSSCLGTLRILNATIFRYCAIICILFCTRKCNPKTLTRVNRGIKYESKDIAWLTTTYERVTKSECIHLKKFLLLRWEIHTLERITETDNLFGLLFLPVITPVAHPHIFTWHGVFLIVKTRCDGGLAFVASVVFGFVWYRLWTVTDSSRQKLIQPTGSP